METHDSELHWYALKVFFNKVFDVEKILGDEGWECYIPCTTVMVERNGVRKQERRTVISSLMFARATKNYAASLQANLRGRVMLYTYTDGEGRKIPSIISDREMNMFRMVVSSGEDDLAFFGDDERIFNVGERVRVTGGPFEGVEGVVRRIKGKRRVLVAVTGVCAVATSFIPACFLQKLQ